MRKTFLTMNQAELQDEVRKLRRQKLRLQRKIKELKQSPDWFSAEGNKGGSYVRLSKAWNDDFRTTKEGMVRLEVGETCIVTIEQDVSVAGLAVVLTRCKDIGFQKVIDDYFTTPAAGGCPKITIDKDVERSNA